MGNSVNIACVTFLALQGAPEVMLHSYLLTVMAMMTMITIMNMMNMMTMMHMMTRMTKSFLVIKVLKCFLIQWKGVMACDVLPVGMFIN